MSFKFIAVDPDHIALAIADVLIAFLRSTKIGDGQLLCMYTKLYAIMSIQIGAKLYNTMHHTD